MAPFGKRPRGYDDDDVTAVESASSSLRQDSQRKKARISKNVSNLKSRSHHERSLSSSSSDAAEAAVDDLDDELPPPIASTQYELFRDDGFRHLENPEQDDQVATQAFLARKERQQKRRFGKNRAADNAIIEEITCINFMCHDRLHVTLGPLINFVVGHNGSGKSAVLTAITLCLGGKVTATNRGANLKSFIKEGRDQAILIIRLKNEGNDAFQPEVYGESIIIERHFSRTGSSSFKLKSAAGRVIATKKGDVDDIVEYFQLQVDNPMNVLTQDAAKSFITASTPAQKYKFFVEGVQLQALDNDYKLISDTCDSIEDKLRGSETDIVRLQKKAEEAKGKYELTKQSEGLRRQRKALGYKAAWAQVVAVENKLAERDIALADCQQAIDSADIVVHEKSQVFQHTEEALERARETERRLESELAPLKEEEESAKGAFELAKNEVSTLHTQTKTIKRDMVTHQTAIATLQKNIQDEERKVEEANGGAHTRKTEEIQEAERGRAAAMASVKAQDESFPELQIKQKQAHDNLREVERKLDAKREDTHKARKTLDSLNHDRGDTMAGFDSRIPRVLQDIREDSGFSQKPVGPLGLFIKLRDPAWSSILETQIGQALNGFVVVNKVDEQRLSRMLDRRNGADRRQAPIRSFTPIFIVNGPPLVNLHEPDSDYETILRVLDIEDERIRRALVITQSIEQQILIKRRSDGMKVMFEGARPKNVKRCHTFHDTQRGHGHSLGFSGRGGRGKAIDPIKPHVHGPRMQTDIESRINEQRDIVNDLQQQQARVENDHRQAQAQVQRANQAITQHKRDLNILKIKVQQTADHVENLRAELSGIDVQDGAIDALKDALKEAEGELKICEEAYGNAGLERNALNETSLQKKRALDTIKFKVSEHETRLKKSQDKIRNVEQARSLSLRDKNTAISNVEAVRARKAVIETKREATVAQLADFNEKAQQICDRVELDPGDTSEKLEAALIIVKRRLTEAASRQGGTDQQIHDAFIRAQTEWETAKRHSAELHELLALLKRSFVRRIEMFRSFQKHISAASRISFSYLLSERAFRGKLAIDHKARKLDVHVEPDETNKSSKGRQTKTLSGGEKSFSSICLLLSLWEAMSAPLRCLDEFDVFMDDVNRDVSTKMIISAARCSVGRQFILITPKALGAGVADGAEDVKIIKLTDPRQKHIDDMLRDD